MCYCRTVVFKVWEIPTPSLSPKLDTKLCVSRKHTAQITEAGYTSILGGEGKLNEQVLCQMVLSTVEQS